jgi:arylsulfatase A-like enzyme
MRIALAVFAAVVALTPISLTRGQGAPAATPQKLNVLFLISDDLRAETSSYAGGQARTPNIDKLAKDGVQFDRAYCQFPLCNPSRSSMLSGRYPTSSNVLGNRDNLRQIHPDVVTLPQLFKNNGYASLRAGKIFHGGIDDPQAWTEGYGEREGAGGAGGHNMVIPEQPVPPQPPDVLPPLPGDIAQRPTSDRIVILDGEGEANPDYAVATKAIGYLNKYKDRPFFIGCGFAKPHSAPAAPQKYFDLYDISKITLPPDFAAWPTVPEGFPKASIRMLNADLFIGRGASVLEAKEYTRAYFASTSWMDSNVGRVLAELDKLGLREKTVIVFWGDHGYQLGEKGKWSKAGSLWEKGARTPLIIRAPGAKANGKATSRIVEAVDIYPTLAELCGLPLPPGVEGKSLVPLLNDPAPAGPEKPAFTIWSEDGRTLTGVAVRTDKYRYAEFDEKAGGGAMLLDETADPHELKNLAEDPKYATVRAEHSALIKEFKSRQK